MGKMTMTKFAVMAGIAALAVSANANTINLTESITGYDMLGTVNAGTPGSGGQELNDLAYVNQLASMTPGTSVGPIAVGDGNNTFVRSANVFSSIGTAITTGDFLGGNNPSIHLNAGQSYTYLIAKYDGPNDLAVVWDIADIIGAAGGGTYIDIPANGPEGKGLSAYTLFESTPSTPNAAPDGASTVTLLGGVLTGLGLLRRKVSKK